MYNTSSSSSSCVCVCVGFHQERATSYVNWNHHHGKCIISWLIAKFRGLSLFVTLVFLNPYGIEEEEEGGRILDTIISCSCLDEPAGSCFFFFWLAAFFLFSIAVEPWNDEPSVVVSFLSDDISPQSHNVNCSLTCRRRRRRRIPSAAQHFQKSLF